MLRRWILMIWGSVNEQGRPEHLWFCLLEISLDLKNLRPKRKHRWEINIKGTLTISHLGLLPHENFERELILYVFFHVFVPIHVWLNFFVVMVRLKLKTWIFDHDCLDSIKFYFSDDNSFIARKPNFFYMFLWLITLYKNMY